MVNDRRFPAPWRADKMPGGYVVRDANGQALVYVYSRDNEGRGSPHHRQRGTPAAIAQEGGLSPRHPTFGQRRPRHVRTTPDSGCVAAVQRTGAPGQNRPFATHNGRGIIALFLAHQKPFSLSR